MPKTPVRTGLLSPGLAILRTPPLGRIGRTTERNQDVAARRTVDLHPDRAVVDVEERTVGAEGVQSQVVLRQRLDDLVDVGLALVETLGPGPEVLYDALDGTSPRLQQVRQVVGGRRQRGNRAGDRIAILGQPGDELLQLVDRRV